MPLRPTSSEKTFISSSGILTSPAESWESVCRIVAKAFISSSGILTSPLLQCPTGRRHPCLQFVPPPSPSNDPAPQPSQAVGTVASDQDLFTWPVWCGIGFGLGNRDLPRL